MGWWYVYDLGKFSMKYQIDTTGGQSGSPVLRSTSNGEVEIVGVHVMGAWSVGSDVGQYNGGVVLTKKLKKWIKGTFTK